MEGSSGVVTSEPRDQCSRPFQPTNWVILVGNGAHQTPAVFLATKADIMNETSGEFPAMFVATKVDILNKMLGEFPAVFLATKPGI